MRILLPCALSLFSHSLCCVFSALFPLHNRSFMLATCLSCESGFSQLLNRVVSTGYLFFLICYLLSAFWTGIVATSCVVYLDSTLKPKDTGYGYNLQTNTSGRPYVICACLVNVFVKPVSLKVLKVLERHYTIAYTLELEPFRVLHGLYKLILLHTEDCDLLI